MTTTPRESPSAPASTRLGPAEILQLDEGGVDRLLDRLEANVPVHDGLIDLPAAPRREAVVFGDTHGDWWTTVAIADRFLENPADRCLVGLGDYVDRAPDDCAEGSVANVLFLLQLVADFPDRVFLIQGNHEANRRIPVVPHDLPEEIDQLWGPDAERYARVMGLLERGPIAALSPSGAYLSHAGFPRTGPPARWREPYERPSEDTLLEVLWTDCAVSRHNRGATRPFDEPALDAFFERSGARIFLRGHDPDLAGRKVYGNRCLTLHSTRIYERYGGVLSAILPLSRTVRSLDEVTVEHVPTEGRSFELKP